MLLVIRPLPAEKLSRVLKFGAPALSGGEKASFR
jgi:hypothetical protein